jgi:hypothetical protein
LSSVPAPVLIVIDILKLVRPGKRFGQADYDTDYEAIRGLPALAHDTPGLSIIVSHHDRKAEADDVFDTLSGTLGLTGGVDTIALLKHARGNVTLHIRGRDLIEEVEKSVVFDRATARWKIVGDAEEVQKSEQRTYMLAALKTAPYGMTTTELRDIVGVESNAAMSSLLQRMVVAGEVARIKRGLYGLPGFDASLRRKRRIDESNLKQSSFQPDDKNDTIDSRRIKSKTPIFSIQRIRRQIRRRFVANSAVRK